MFGSVTESIVLCSLPGSDMSKDPSSCQDTRYFLHNLRKEGCGRDKDVPQNGSEFCMCGRDGTELAVLFLSCFHILGY